VVCLSVPEAGSQTLSILQRFPSSHPSPISLGPDGAIYGFAWGDSQTSETGLYRLTETGGLQWLPGIAYPVDGRLFQGPGNHLYGIDLVFGGGQIFRLTDDGQVSIVISGLADSQNRSPMLVGANSEHFFWVSFNPTNSKQSVVVYRLGELPTKIYEFEDKIIPNALILGTDGSFYGVASNSTKPAHCRLFRLKKSGEFSWLCTVPRRSSEIVQTDDGQIYGTSWLGGRYLIGCVYRWRPGLANAQILYNFDGSKAFVPEGPLLYADGFVYGIAGGGPGGHGVIYRIDSKGNFQLVYAFSGLDGRVSLGGGVSPYGLIKKGTSLLGVATYENAQATEHGGQVFKLDVPKTITEPGEWDGLLRTGSSNSVIVGRTSMNLNSTGSFSLKLNVGRDRIVVHGSFFEGRFSKKVVGSTGPYLLRLNWLPSGRVHGNISKDSFSASFNQVPRISDGNPFWLSRPNFNLALVPKLPENPWVNGYASFRSRGADRTILTGALPDGTPFSAGLTVGHGCQFGFFIPLPGNNVQNFAGTLHTAGYREGGVPKTKRIPGHLLWTRGTDPSAAVPINAIGVRPP
jgi:uncharacterized repeat protein (TIGR03803 family)